MPAVKLAPINLDSFGDTVFGSDANGTTITFDSPQGDGTVKAGQWWIFKIKGGVVRTPTRFGLSLPFMNNKQLVDPSWLVSITGDAQAVGVADTDGSINNMLLEKPGALGSITSTAYGIAPPAPPPSTGIDALVAATVLSWQTRQPVTGVVFPDNCLKLGDLPTYKETFFNNTYTFPVNYLDALSPQATLAICNILGGDATPFQYVPPTKFPPGTDFLMVPLFPQRASVVSYPYVWWIRVTIDGKSMEALAAFIANALGSTTDSVQLKTNILACFVPTGANV